MVFAAWCTRLQVLALLSGAEVEVVTLDWQQHAVQSRKSLCSAAGEMAVSASWCTRAYQGASYLAVIWPSELVVWAVSAQQRNIRADKLLEIRLTNMSAAPQRVSWLGWADAPDSTPQSATVAIWSAEGVHLHTMAWSDASGSVRQLASSVCIAPPTPGRRVCGAWSSSSSCLAICSGGEVAVTCLPDAQALGKCSATSHKALCVEAAMNAQQQQQQQQIVLGPMRAVVAAGNGCFVGTTSGGMNLGTTASSDTQMKNVSSSSSSAANDSLFGILTQSTQSVNSIASLQMPGLQASSSSSSSGSGGITDLSISAADSSTVIGVSRSINDNSFLRILSPSHAVNSSAADSFAAASSAQPDRRARLVLIQTTTSTIAAATDKAAAAALRVTVPTSVPLPLQLATPDLLACSSNGAWTVVGSHACSRLLCYNSTTTTSSTSSATATALTAVLTLQLPEVARPRGVLIVPTEQRRNSNSSSKQCSEWAVCVLAAWPTSSATTTVKAGSGYVLCSTQLLIFDLPTPAVFGSATGKQHTAQELVTTASATVTDTEGVNSTITVAAASTVAEIAQLLQAFEQRLNTRLDALCAVVEQQGKQLTAIEQHLQARRNAP
jgi:hypothetical protein